MRRTVEKRRPALVCGTKGYSLLSFAICFFTSFPQDVHFIFTLKIDISNSDFPISFASFSKNLLSLVLLHLLVLYSIKSMLLVQRHNYPVPNPNPIRTKHIRIPVFFYIDDISTFILCWNCLLYTSDAADDLLCVDLGGRRIIKK